MPSSINQTGHFTLLAFKIKSLDGKKEIDISKVIHTFNIEESMEKTSIRGAAVVYEVYDLIQSFPLKGEELIEITYTDFFEVERTEHMFLYSITNMEYNNNAGNFMNKYTIHFVSIGKFIADQKRIQKSYGSQGVNSKISDFVIDTFQEYYKNEYNKKDFVVELTTGETKFVIPNYTPDQAMNFFAKRAFSSENLGQTFRFFESRDKYFFITNAELFKLAKNNLGYGDGLIDPKLGEAAGIENKPIHIFRRNYAKDNRPDRQREMMYEILSIATPKLVNSVDDINAGAYFKEFYEIDLLNNVINKNLYDHGTSANTLFHNQDFINETMVNRPNQSYVIKDYSTEGQGGSAIRPDQRYLDLYTRKKTEFYHYNNNKVACKIYGRNDIFAGSVIDLELYEVKVQGGTDIDQMRSGRYLVNDVNNIFHESVFVQDLVISKEIT
jgi:hypothetical protein